MHASQPTRAAGGMLEVTTAHRKRERADDSCAAGGKWRKPTYIARKEEKEQLMETIEKLRRRVHELQQPKPTPTLDERAISGALRKELEMLMLRHAMRSQQLSVTQAQSAMSSYVSTQERVPHEMNVFLGTDVKQRRDTLVSLKSRKIRAALEYMSARTRFLDPFRSFAETSRYLLDNGDFCALHFDRVVLNASHVSVRQVYDALCDWVRNAEMLVTDKLDDITTRDETVYDDVGIQQNRFVSKLSTGVPLELNMVNNFEFFECSEDHADGGPLGVLAEDFVDRDELFPYSPSDRVRQDLTAVVTVRSHSRKRLNPATNQVEEQTVVVFTRSCLLKLHKPQLELSPVIEHDLRQGIAEWADVMLTSVINQAYSHHLG